MREKEEMASDGNKNVTWSAPVRESMFKSTHEHNLGIDPEAFDRAFEDIDNVRARQYATEDVEKERERDRDRARPVTVVDSIRSRFRADPVEAVKNNVSVHAGADRIAEFEPEIVEIAQAHQRQAVAADELWKNGDFDFIKRVQGLTNIKTLMDREVDMDGTGSGGRGLIQATPLADVRSAAANRPGAMAEDLFGTGYRQGEVRIEATEATRRMRERYRILANIDAVANAPQVSGEIQMSSEMHSAVNSALLQLTVLNRNKFLNASRHSFYDDTRVKQMFAQLVAAILLEVKVTNPNQYYTNITETRRDRKVVAATDLLNDMTTWDEGRKCFVFSTVDEIEKKKQEKRDRILEIYNV